jgi:predicted dehydrogenase
MKTGRYGVGVVGVGGISRLHMPGWEASLHAEVVAGVDTQKATLENWGKEHGIDRLATDLDEILSDPTIDIVDICTPNMYHTEQVVRALEAGKHVLCEKPLAPTPQEIEKMIAARDAAGKELMTAQHFRFSGASQAVKREIDTGVLGEIYHARGWMLRRNAFIPTPTFFHKEHSGGGACIDIGVHILDLCLWLMGNPEPVTVTGVARTELALQEGQFTTWRPSMEVPKTMDVEEFAAAFVRFENGATLVMEVSWLLHHDTEGEDMQAWLYGRDGGCHWPSAEFLNSNLMTKELYNRTLRMTKNAMEPHAAECVEFARALAEGQPSPVPAEHSLQVLSILDAIYRSQRSGREVRLDTHKG